VPPLALQQRRVDGRPVQGRAPADLVHVGEAEELERGLVEHRGDEDERETGGDPAEHVRQQLAEDNPPGRLAGDARRQDELALPEPERLTTQHARLDRPAGEADDQRHRPRPRMVEEGADHDQERERRDDDEDVGRQVDHVVDKTALVGGEEPEHDRDRHRDHRRRERDEQ
jgi:hypothetical protein